MDYTILQNEILPIAFHNKPRWITCAMCAVGLLIITLSAVSVGAFIGYTYCYVEHRRGFRKGDTTHDGKPKIVGLPSQANADDKNTINSILFSGDLVSRLVQIGQSIKADISHLRLADLKDSLCRKRSQINTTAFL